MKIARPGNMKRTTHEHFRSLPASMIDRISGQSSSEGRTIIFHGAGGGAGTTTLAGETAVYLSGAGYRTVALDMNLFGGSLHYKLDVPDSKNSYTISDLVPVINDIDDRTVNNSLSRSPFGPCILPAPPTCTEAEKVTPSHLQKLIPILLENFQRIVIDTPPAFDTNVRVLFELADLAVLTIVPDIFSIGRALRFLKDLELCFNNRPVIRIVLNKSAGKLDPLSAADIESFLGVSISAVISDETATCRNLSCHGRQIIGSKTGAGNSFDSAIRQLFPSF